MNRCKKSSAKIPIRFKKDGTQYVPEKNIAVLAEDCIHQKQYNLALKVLDKTFDFPAYEKIFLGQFLITPAQILNNTVGDKKNYYLDAISDIAPRDAAILNNKSIKVLKYGAFTATLTFKSNHKTQPQVVIKKAQFTILPFEKPIIQGTPLIGKSLEVQNLKKIPKGWQFIFQWYRNNALIGAASTKKYTLQNADLSKNIKVKVTLKKGKQAHTQESNTIVNIIDHPKKPILTGLFYQDESLTYTNPPAAARGWQQIIKWYRQTSSGSAVISGASKAKYVLKKQDVSHQIKVSIQLVYKVTGGKTNEVFSDPTGAINPAIALPQAPTIEGVPIVGEKLNAKVNGAVPSGFKLLIEWAYKSSPNVIVGKGTQYTLTNKDLGKELIIKTRYYKGTAHGKIAASNPYERIINHPDIPVISGGPEEAQRTIYKYCNSPPRMDTNHTMVPYSCFGCCYETCSNQK